jgi:hypothetical protein
MPHDCFVYMTSNKRAAARALLTIGWIRLLRVDLSGNLFCV